MDLSEIELPQLNCDDCGVCCMAIGHPHFMRPADQEVWDNMPQELKDEVDAYLATLTDLDLGQPCIWLDLETKKCKHYEHRPHVCRDFEVGNRHCHRLREQAGIPAFNVHSDDRDGCNGPAAGLE